MYHLTRHKYWFFGISLAVIVPGLLALIFWGLNLGIDFTNGSSIQLRFANSNVTTAQVAQVFRNAHAQDVNVFASTDLQSTVNPSQYAYITFDRPIGTNEQATVMSKLSDKKANLPNVTRDKTYFQLAGANGKSSAMIVVHFDKPVQASAVQAALKNLPATDLPPTTSVTGGATPTASATSSTTATTTPSASSATATPAPATSQTFPVSVSNVTIGANTQIYQVDTQTSVNTSQTGGSKASLDLDTLTSQLNQSFGPVYVVDQTSVGPSIAQETTRNAFFAVLFASAAILLYIGIAFRKVGSAKRSFRFGASAIIALLHDVLVVVGVWAILGHFFDFKVDSLFLTAVLTVIGFSVHDTIVVFDRLRENLSRRTSESFETVVDASLVQTMSRSLNTSLTVIITLTALTLFGGASIYQFTLALLIGILSGTYSSIFNASMILVVWETGEYRNWFGRNKGKGTPARGTTTAARRELAGTRA